MKKVAILIDSSFSIDVNSLPDVYVVPMIVTETRDEKITSYKDIVDISHDELCSKISNGSDIKTNQPILGDVMKMIEELSTKYEFIFGFTIPLTISGTFQTWKTLENEYKNFKVFDQTMVGHLSAWTIYDFVEQNKKGQLNEEFIVSYLEKTKTKRAGVLIVPDATQLKKGGRVSNFKSLLIKLFNLKLIITLDGNGLLFKDKSSNIQNALVKAKKALSGCIPLDSCPIKRFVIYSNTIDEEKFKIQDYINGVEKMFPNIKIERNVVPTVIAAHVGPNYFVFGIDLE